MAADIINPEAISEGALSFFSGAGTTVMWIIFAVLVAILIWFIYFLLSFKIKVIVRETVKGGKTLVKYDRGKLSKDRNGVFWLKLFKYRIKLPEPDNDYYDITTRGKKVIEYSKTGVDFKPISITSTGLDTDKTFSPSQRQMMIHECRESESYRKKTTMDLLRDAIPYMALVILIIGLLIFMPDIIESKTAVVSAYDGVAEKLITVAEKLDTACNTQTETNPKPKEPPN